MDKKKDRLGNVIVYGLIVAVAVAVFFLERGRWRECLRVHPFWYCLTELK